MLSTTNTSSNYAPAFIGNGYLATRVPAAGEGCRTGDVLINSDIALAQWRYYEVTGDTAWLRDKAWLVLKDVANYWVSRSTSSGAGAYDITRVRPPDEYVNDVDTSAYTNASAQAALRIAVQAAGVIGKTADPAWSTVANGLKIPVDTTKNIHPEYQGYNAQQIKQADVTMLQYP